MKRKHQKTLEQIFSRPVSGNIKWSDIESLLQGLGAKLKSDKAQESVLFCLVRFKFFIDLIRHLTPTKEQFQVFENGWKEKG